ncbi:MAG: molybdopterin adenylyltransferase [Bacteroidales bacterium]|nr:molybdopterin adenylyltransferase [Bacteroidales bacterium]
MKTIQIAIITVSDRSSKGEREDSSGPLLVKLAEEQGWNVIFKIIIPDEIPEIKKTLIEICDNTETDIILTTGGTGFTPRDVTPEATLSIIEKETPGISEAMRFESLKITPHAMLSRGVCGIRGNSLIINLPGSPKAAKENFNVVLPVLPHAIELIRNSPASDSGHQSGIFH